MLWPSFLSSHLCRPLILFTSTSSIPPLHTEAADVGQQQADQTHATPSVLESNQHTTGLAGLGTCTATSFRQVCQLHCSGHKGQFPHQLLATTSCVSPNLAPATWHQLTSILRWYKSTLDKNALKVVLRSIAESSPNATRRTNGIWFWICLAQSRTASVMAYTPLCAFSLMYLVLYPDAPKKSTRDFGKSVYMCA